MIFYDILIHQIRVIFSRHQRIFCQLQIGNTYKELAVRQREILNDSLPSKPCTQSSGNSTEEEAESVRVKSGGHWENKTLCIKQGSYKLGETEAASTKSLHGSAGGSLCIYFSYQLNFLNWIPECVSEWICYFQDCSWNSFPSVGFPCPVSM